MKVLTWNVARAGTSRTALWDLLQHEDPDIIVLQEVTDVPTEILNVYQCYRIKPKYFDWSFAPYFTAVLSKKLIDSTPYLASDLGWVNAINAECPSWFIECETVSESGERIRVVSVHAPAGPIPKDRWIDEDASALKLTNNPDWHINSANGSTLFSFE